MGLTGEQLREGIDAVAAREPKVAEAVERVGYPEPRIRPTGYQTLLRAIVGQQVSVAAASSMWAKLEAELGPDIWPAGDLAVQAGLARILALPERPSEKATRELAEPWRPHRGAVAILTWHSYNNPAL